MTVEVAPDVLVKIVELAGDLTKNAQHPSSAVLDDEPILEYRINLFEKTVKALHRAVSQSDER